MRCHDARNGDLKGYDATMEISDYDERTASLGWPVLGCYPRTLGRDRHYRCVQVVRFVTASHGRIVRLSSLYRWPCNQQIPCKTYKGHGRSVAMCRFTPDGSYLATVGDQDRCLLQWAVVQWFLCQVQRIAACTYNE